MRRKLTPEEIDKLRKDFELEDADEDNELLQAYIKGAEDEIYNSTSSIETAEIGERLWTALPTQKLVQCTVLEEEPTFPVEYKVKLDTQDEPITLSHTLLFKEQRACALNELQHIVREYARAESWLMESFTGIHYERWTQTDPSLPSRFKEGDEVWYRDGKDGTRLHKGVIKAIEKETDKYEAPFAPYRYSVESRNEESNYTACFTLTDEDLYRTRAECIMSILSDRQYATIMGDLEIFQMLVGTEEQSQESTNAQN